MAAKWTEAQLDAINARRGTVLVSAAAGSGKTAVLVERVMERLTDEENPTDADRLLVVTFTKAAAAEMRERIERRLLEMIREHPENSRLRRQQLLLQQRPLFPCGQHLRQCDIVHGQILCFSCRRRILSSIYIKEPSSIW